MLFRWRVSQMGILIIDNESVFSGNLKLALKRSEYFVESTTNPIEALKLYKKDKYDIVITDLNISLISGFELVRIIRAMDEKSVIIVITANDEKKIKRELINCGAFKVLTKPFKLSVLIEMLKKIEELKKGCKYE